MEQEQIQLSDLHTPKLAFVSERKVARMAAQMKGFVGKEETPAERATNIMFLANLLVSVTVMARAILEKLKPNQWESLGVIQLCHTIAENLKYRVSSSTPRPHVWSMEHCLVDYLEVAKHFGVENILHNALEMATHSIQAD
jgi:hypothetical protein